ncbi:hypothetical protein [Deinococcus sp. JMULE3]|uniref:hypothetical protein n=1 Tax=Deinococcus sp. JMULE3 TaxID=2518341 RepID=UPI00157734B0|nr:hypothetical protein [Deinococcus sp. JMULE3]NTX99289.1 hypothetical protein [Deinococcus sp. JMULE3]
MKRVVNWMTGAGLLLDAQLRWFFALALLSCGYAFAQEGLPDMGADPLGWLRTMASNPFALGAVVFGLVEAWKQDAAKREPPLDWKPWRWRTLAFVIGLGGSVVARLAVSALPGGVAFTAADLPVTLVNGLLAGLVSIAGWNSLRTLTKWIFPDRAAADTQTGSAAAAAQTAGTREGDPAAPPAAAFQEAEAARAMRAMGVPAQRGMDAVVALGMMGGSPTPFLGPVRALAPAVLATLRQILAELLPEQLTAAQAAELAIRLAPVIADLADGSTYLSDENRGRLLDAARDVLDGAA